MTLGCGSLKKYTHGMRQVYVRNKKQLQEIIVPFFSKYLINTEKAKDFKDFSTAVSILYEVRDSKILPPNKLNY